MRRRFGRIASVVLAAGLVATVAVEPSAHADGVQDPWYMETLQAEEIWRRADGEGVTVAVIDTGVDASVPELEGQVLEGTDLTLSPEGAHTDEKGHGTDMAALIAGTGAAGGIQGLAPEARILPVRVTSGFREWDFGMEERIANAIQYAVDEGAQIISISLAPEADGAGREEVDTALVEAAREDVLIFAGTGNWAEEPDEPGGEINEPEFPSDREGVVGVAAVDTTGQREDYSTYGPQVSLSGPAEAIPGHCEWPERKVCLFDEGGTSSATALVSASAALIRSAHPDWTKNQVLRAMIETADSPANGERNDEIGYGMVRPDRVILNGEGDPGDPDTNPLFASFEATMDPPPTPDPAADTPDTPTETPTTQDPDAEPTSQPGASSNTDMPPAPTASSNSDSGSLILFGLAGAVLTVGVVTALILHRRSTTRV
jgi:type VII secretion-associated serine protease mycosin